MAVRRSFLLVGLAGLVVGACSGGDSDSITDAGNTTPATAAATTVPADTSGGTDGTTAPGGTEGTEAPTTTAAPATTVATPLDDLPPCPTDALATADGPIEITFWHGMSADNEVALQAVTDAYNASQDLVVVKLENQGGYEKVIDKYLLSDQGSRPVIAQAPEYAAQAFRDTDSFVPVGACMQSSGWDSSAILPAALNAYTIGGVQWSMPFNVSNPVLYYNKKVFAAAGLDPDSPPQTLEEIEAYSKQIVESGAAAYGLVVDSDFDGGGGWYLEQWFAKAGEFYADNENGRSAPATKVLFDGPTGVDIFSFLGRGVQEGWMYNVGDNASGQDAFLKIADEAEPGAMTIGTSAALGTVLAALRGGLAPSVAETDLGIGFMPGPDGSPAVLVGGASLWIAKDKGDAETAAAWDYLQYLVTAEAQSQWSAATGYLPINDGAVTVEPLASVYTADPRFSVAFESLVQTPDVPTSVGPLLGPQREIRFLTASALAAVYGGADPQTELTNAATQANSLLADYAARQEG